MKNVFFLFFLLWLGNLDAQIRPVSTAKNWSTQNVEPNIGVLPETHGQVLDTHKVVLGHYDNQFLPFNAVKIGGGLVGYWLHLSIDNSMGAAQTLYLGTNRFDYIDFWWRTDTVVSIGQKSGQLIPDAEKPVNISGLSFFSFQLPANKKTDLYFKVANKKSVDLPQLIIPITLMNEAEFYRSYKRPTDFTLMFLGAVGIMVAFNLMLFFITGLRAYLLYTGYVLAMTMFDLAITPQFAMQIFGHMDVTRPYVCTAGQAALSMYILVARELTESSIHFPRIDRAIRFVLMALAIAVPLAFWEPTVLLATVINFASALSVYPPLIGIAIIMALRGHSPSRYFLFATAIFIVGDVVMILQLLGVLPPVLFGLAPSTYVQIGVAVELALFSLGLGARIQEMRHTSVCYADIRTHGCNAPLCLHRRSGSIEHVYPCRQGTYRVLYTFSAHRSGHSICVDGLGDSSAFGFLGADGIAGYGHQFRFCAIGISSFDWYCHHYGATRPFTQSLFSLCYSNLYRW